jgi:hypothetical protein
MNVMKTISLLFILVLILCTKISNPLNTNLRTSDIRGQWFAYEFDSLDYGYPMVYASNWYVIDTLESDSMRIWWDDGISCSHWEGLLVDTVFRTNYNGSEIAIYFSSDSTAKMTFYLPYYSSFLPYYSSDTLHKKIRRFTTSTSFHCM